MGESALRLIGGELPMAPYPADTRAKGFKFDLDVEQLEQSKTWLLTPPELRPWLLRLWVESWKSIPVGSFEDDNELIAARIQMPLNQFEANKKILMRGWRSHADGRMYHGTITEMVLKIVTWRDAEKARKAAWRDSRKQKCPTGQTRDRRGTPWDGRELTAADDTSSSSSSSSSSLRSEDITHASHESAKPAVLARTKPPCPYGEILALWRQLLPELPQPKGVDYWTEARKAQIRARWQDQLPDLATWRRMMEDIRQSPFLMGRRQAPGRRPFKADLFWITKPENLLRLQEGKYDD